MPPDSPRQKRGLPSLAFQTAKRIFTPVALGFIVFMAWKNRSVLAGLAAEASLGMLALSLILWACTHLVAPFFSRAVLGACGSEIGYGAALQIHANRLPARYIPGGIWHTVGRVADFHARGALPRHLALFVFLENSLAAGTTFLMGGGLLFYYRHWQRWGVAGALGALAGALALLVIPAFSRRFILKEKNALHPAAYAKALGVAAGFWILASASFCVYFSAFPGARAATPVLETAGAYMFGWAVGNVTVFAPQGIGVFEAMAAGLLKGSMPLGGMAALLAGFRAVALLADFLTWAAARVIAALVTRRPDRQRP